MGLDSHGSPYFAWRSQAVRSGVASTLSFHHKDQRPVNCTSRIAPRPAIDRHRILHVTLESSLIPFREFLDLLQAFGTEVNPEGDGWVARCPAHDDHKPSLRISRGNDGKLLICCLAGCTFDAIIRRRRVEEIERISSKTATDTTRQRPSRPTDAPRRPTRTCVRPPTPSPDARASGTTEPTWDRL